MLEKLELNDINEELRKGKFKNLKFKKKKKKKKKKPLN
jgi:hypothetical protein